jgi:hypothetical protein
VGLGARPRDEAEGVQGGKLAGGDGRTVNAKLWDWVATDRDEGWRVHVCTCRGEVGGDGEGWVLGLGAGGTLEEVVNVKLWDWMRGFEICKGLRVERGVGEGWR